MGSPCEPLTPRQELISELEGYGYDIGYDAPANWRETMSDAELSHAASELARSLNAEAR